MIKHYCDKCGKEISIPTMWDVYIESPDTDTIFYHEVCSECALKLKRLFENKAESEDKG